MFEFLQVIFMIILFGVIPFFGIASLVLAAMDDGSIGFWSSAGWFLTAIVWDVTGILLTVGIEFLKIKYLADIFFIVWFSASSVPFFLMARRGYRDHRRWKFLAGICGGLTVLLVWIDFCILAYLGIGV